ncbi:helix-turn-helix domain-containing protein [Haloglomus litoreum]|uniref:helix-turn-helix domain-containing protein n=1 Tax=Haloglomus litoreum TaxID=3034026 RepID=UPI0023E7BFB4|nr:helix-turn-helix domain-containing protein [Haloglomus sp. DT116]
MRSECLVVEFQVTGDDCPLADASRAASATIDAAPPLVRSDGNTLLRASTPAEAVGRLLDTDDRVRYLHGSQIDGRWNYRCLSKQPCVVHDLVDVGFLVESVHHREGTERHVGAVVGYDVLDSVLEAAGDRVGVSLERVTTLGEEGDAPIAQRWDLTPAQEKAVRAALAAGYFSVPRDVTAAEVAETLGISKSAFLERLRRGQGSLFTQLFGNE